nr:lipase family protein [Rhodococcus sp. (in: high G+C Gram-positive bacteria)]
MKFVVLIVVAVLTLTGCASAVSLAFTAPGLVGVALLPEEPEVIEVADAGTGPGSVIYAETLPNLPITATRGGMNSARVVYRSVDDSEVSGTVFTPRGDAPEGGWPVISFGHGTTGILPACGPSLSRTLLGTADLAAGFTSAGYAVAVTDYEGLGHEGVHRYLDNERAGYNVIDAVRALRTTFPDVSNRWVAFGGSQGGGATWAANELAGYAPELDLLGSVSLAPGANMAGLVDKSIAGTLTADQAPLVQWVIESLARANPEIDRDDYRSGSAAADWDALTGCTPADASARGEAAQRIGPTDFAPRTPEAADRLRARLDEFSVPKEKASAPMMVVYGDADTYIDVAWTDEALVKACGLGDVITIDRQPGKGHGDVDGDAVNQWIGERFAGDPVVDDCN